MAVKIGHAVMDEDGASVGAVPGDQTGKEIATRNWYNRAGGWGIYLEPTDSAMADRAATCMEQICADSAFGYSQKTRWTGYEAIKANGGTVSGAAQSNFDCSSLCISCYILAGLNHKPTGYTGSMATSLTATGKFVKHTDAAHLQSADYAVRGGLYIAPGKHVAMVLTDGPKAGQSAIPADIAAEADDIQPPYVLLLGNVRIRTGPGTQYPKLFTGKRGSKYPYFETDADTGWYIISTSMGDGYVSGKAAYTRLVT